MVLVPPPIVRKYPSIPTPQAPALGTDILDTSDHLPSENICTLTIHNNYI